MSKKNAFAFRDFDKDQILSRKFFSSLKLPTGSDKEILQSFDISEVNGAEKAIVIFADMRQMIKSYLERIKRHALKLESVNKKIAVRIVESGDDETLKEKFERSKVLSQKYNDVTFDIGNLFHRLQDKMDGCDAVTGKFYRKRFSESLKLARQKSGITQKKLAQLIGVSVNSCIGYENGRREPSLSIIRRMMNVLKVSADKLIY